LARIAQLFKSKKSESEVKRCVSGGYFILAPFLSVGILERSGQKYGLFGCGVGVFLILQTPNTQHQTPNTKKNLPLRHDYAFSTR
jgi:hypothetical protein